MYVHICTRKYCYCYYSSHSKHHIQCSVHSVNSPIKTLYRTARKCDVYCSKRALRSGVAFASTFGYNLFLLDTYSQCQLCVLRPLLALPLEGRGRTYHTVRDLSSPCQMRLAVVHTTQSAHMVIVHTESGLSFCTKRRLSRSESMKAVKLRT